ncbi:MAG: glycosyltransferase family 4 protein [Terriglobales bacterium]
MTGTSDWYFNGRILSGAPGGVRRYAEQVLPRLPVQPIVLRPKVSRGPLGHLWEQTLLPSLAHGLLWSPANVGPLAASCHVVTIHDVAPLDHPEWFSWAFGRWYTWLLPRLARRATHIITVSEFSKSRIVERCCVPAEKITVTPLAAAERFRPLAAAEAEPALARFGLARSGFVLAVGTLEPRKNLQALLRAWGAALPALPGGLELVIAGPRGSRSVFRSTGLDEIQGRVRWLGRVSDTDLVALYSAAWLFVFPSLYEGFGFPPLEAMACGAPVLCSNAASLPEVVGDAAITFGPRDTDALALLLVQLLTAPEHLAGMGARGPARAARFSWGKCAAVSWSALAGAARSSGVAVTAGNAGEA